jgi:hypothetical protein
MSGLHGAGKLAGELYDAAEKFRTLRDFGKAHLSGNDALCAVKTSSSCKTLSTTLSRYGAVRSICSSRLSITARIRRES